MENMRDVIKRRNLEIKEGILRTVEKSIKPLSMSDIARELGTQPVTIAKHIKKLAAEGAKLRVDRVGNTLVVTKA